MPPKKIVKVVPKKVVAPPAPSGKKAPPPPLPPSRRKTIAKEEEHSATAEEEESVSPQKRARTGAGGSSDAVQESPAKVSSNSTVVGTSGLNAGSPGAARSPPTSATKKATRLHVPFHLSEGSGMASLDKGLVRLRRNNQFCDMTIISNLGRIPAHRAVLAANSEKLASMLQANAEGVSEIDLQYASPEAADLAVCWLYGEVGIHTYRPSTPKVNEEVLRISSELGLPPLAELCALRLAEASDTSNVVSSVRLCEEYELPRLRTALVTAVVEDSRALDAVAKDPATLSHPALMQQLLAAIAGQVPDAPLEEEQQPTVTRTGKRFR